MGCWPGTGPAASRIWAVGGRPVGPAAAAARGTLGRHNGSVDAVPETRYARNGPIHLAYQVLGSGPPDLLVVNSGPNSHVDYMWAEPSVARFLRRLASFSRLILYDSRGVGLSDPVPGTAVPTMDEQVDDIGAVLDEAGSQRAVVAGHLAGCAPAMVFAAAHPDRVESLVLLGGYARLLRGAGYPDGVEQAHVDQITGLILDQWGAGDDLDVTNPSKAGDEGVPPLVRADSADVCKPGDSRGDGPAVV